jgi:hypothetical protein
MSTLEDASEIFAGVERTIRSDSPSREYCVLFEDDGETGYFYGARRGRFTSKLTILDALHIYNVEAVRDRARPHRLSVRWSANGLHAALLINGFPHAAFDFEARAACCMNDFPPPSPWCRSSHQWDPELIAFVGGGTAPT